MEEIQDAITIFNITRGVTGSSLNLQTQKSE